MTQAKLIVLKYKIKLEYKSLKEIFDAKLLSFITFGRENVGNIQQIKIV